MKKINTLIIGTVFIFSVCFGQKETSINYQLNDSIKISSFVSDVKFSATEATAKSKNYKALKAGIRNENISLSWDFGKGQIFTFKFPSNAVVLVKGINVKHEKESLSWVFFDKPQNMFSLMLSVASDSSENFKIYSAYVNTRYKQWKLIGTVKITGEWGTLKNPATYYNLVHKNQPTVSFINVWGLRTNSSWKKMDDSDYPVPDINLYNNADTAERRKADIKIIEDSIAAGKTDAKQHHAGIYYAMIKEGTGRHVQITDTVTAHYKGYLLSDGTVFDQTKEKPATFPLSRLIKGWQIGVPLCKVGGKIKLVIPSGLAYSIRTRAAKIPPNSILVFEIEVVDTKEAK